MVLVSYARLWVLAALSRDTQGFVAFQSGRLGECLCSPFIGLLCCTFVWPRPCFIATALLARIVIIASKLPLVHDSQWWVVQVDAVLLLALLSRMCRTPRTLFGALPAADAANIMTSISPIVRSQMTIFYSAAVLLRDSLCTPAVRPSTCWVVRCCLFSSR